MQEVVKQMSLVTRTKELMKERPRHLTIAVISSKTGLTVGWLQSFSATGEKDPGANRVQTLYEFLTGKQLEVA